MVRNSLQPHRTGYINSKISFLIGGYSCFIELLHIVFILIRMSSKVTSLVFTFPLFTYAIELVKDFIVSMMRTSPIPKHIGLIMDGNRRYAKAKDIELKDGHSAGADSLIQVCRNTKGTLGKNFTNSSHIGIEYVLQAWDSPCYGLCFFY